MIHFLVFKLKLFSVFWYPEDRGWDKSRVGRGWDVAVSKVGYAHLAIYLLSPLSGIWWWVPFHKMSLRAKTALQKNVLKKLSILFFKIFVHADLVENHISFRMMFSLFKNSNYKRSCDRFSIFHRAVRTGQARTVQTVRTTYGPNIFLWSFFDMN